jgi:hypothetical protein
MSEEEPLFRLRCVICGVHYGITRHCHDTWQTIEKNFYCPNGHAVKFLKLDPEIEKLRKEVATIKVQISIKDSVMAKMKKQLEDLNLELEIWKPSEEKKEETG